MTRPFVIFALPRSRTAWLSHFLTYGGNRCGHDIAIECASVSDFVSALRTDYDGTVETGSVIGWKALMRNLPDAKIIVLKRSIDDVQKSLCAVGIGDQIPREELDHRATLMDQVSRIPGVLTIQFPDLTTVRTCSTLFEECLDKPFDWEWWAELHDKNIQIDIPQRIARLIENAPLIDALKAEVAPIQAEPFVTIAREKWAAIWPEVDGLGRAHFQEVDGGIEPNRPYNLDADLMQQMCASGVLLLVTARVDGRLVGYCTWQMSMDVECKGLPIAQQGAWFVSPDFDHLHLGTKMFKKSVADMKALGVKNIFPHRRTQGRGDRLDAFFLRQGAKEIQRTFSMWIGD